MVAGHQGGGGARAGGAYPQQEIHGVVGLAWCD